MHHPTTQETRATLRARLFGLPEIAVHGRTLAARDWSGRKARPMLLILLSTPGHVIHREQLVDLLWPELDLDAGMNAFFKALHSLRRTLEPELRSGRESRFIDTRNENVSLSSNLSLWVDVDQFSDLVTGASTAGDRERRHMLRQALDLVGGPLIADAPYDDWLVPRRQALDLERERAVLHLAQLDLEAGEPLATLPYLDAMITQEPTLEVAHRAIMRAYQAAGQAGLALRQYESLRTILRDDLDGEPEAETTRLAEAVEHVPDHSPVDAKRQAMLAKSRSLPALPTPTVGRTDEIAELTSLLEDPAVRLVSVLGTGGVGKTRLATDVAFRLRDQFPDGAGFVPLAAIDDPELLFTSIATALGIPSSPREPAREVVTRYLQVRTKLLILDNLEHLTAIASEVAELIEICPGLTILATSRVPLHIRAEHRFSLDVLDLPTAGPGALLSLESFESTALFLQSVRALHYHWTPSSDERSAIASICIQCDGLPLALELAAARCTDLTPADVLRQLESRPRIMTLRDGPRDLPSRHQGLRELVRWSYDLLASDEQALLRRLSVFAGGVELDALNALGGERAVPLANALVDKNLAKWTHAGGSQRLIMLETIREVAGELLAEFEHEAIWHERHARYFTELNRELHDQASSGRNQVAIVDRLDRDIDNIRAALSRSMSQEMVPAYTALELAAYSSWFWFWKGYTQEGYARLDAAMTHRPGASLSLQCLSASWLAQFAMRMRDEPNFTRWRTLTRELADQTKDPRDHIRACKLQSQLLQQENRWDESIQLNESLLPLCRQLGDQMLVMDRYMAIASGLHRRGEMPQALAHLDDALAIARSLSVVGHECNILLFAVGIAHDMGDEHLTGQYINAAERAALLSGNQESLAWATYQRAGLVSLRGDKAAAAAIARRASTFFAEIGVQRMVGGALITAGTMEGMAGNTMAAFEAHLESLPLVRAFGTPEEHMSSAMEVGYLCIDNGNPIDGLPLLAFTVALFEQVGFIAPDDEQKRLDEHVEKARESLPPDTFVAAWKRGDEMSVGQALDLVEQICGRAIRQSEAVA